MITPAFGLTATERVLPSMALDFTTAVLDSRVTLTRAGTATRVKPDGYIDTVAADAPRFDYDPVTLVCKGLLIEESRTNSLRYSADFSNAVWAKSLTTVSSGQTTSPTGSLNGFTFVHTATSGADLSQAFTFSAIAYTLTVYIKYKSNQWVRLNVVSGLAWFDVQNGVVGTTTSSTASIQNAGNGWYRCSITVTPAAGANSVGIINASADASNTRTLSDNYIWGAQLEVGAFATSYIPTTTTALTRNADVATMTGTNFSDWFNASEGAVYHEVTPIALTGQSAYSINNGTNNESIYSYDTSARYYYRIRTGAATQATISSPPGTAVVGTTTKCVTAYESANFGISANGAATSTAASGNLPSGVTQLQIAPANNLYFRKLMYWPQRLTNAEVQAFCK